VDGNAKKMASKTKYGFYEFLMPFELCNVSSTFTMLENTIFHEYMDEFVVVYINDIIIFSISAKEHARHVEMMLQNLRDNKLYANGEKSDFGLMKIGFFRHYDKL